MRHKRGNPNWGKQIPRIPCACSTRKATGTAIPTVSDTISTSGVSISSGTAIHSTTLSDFTSTAISANDILAFNVSAVTSAKYIYFDIQCDQ